MSSLLTPPHLYAKCTIGHKNLGCQEGIVTGSCPHAYEYAVEGGRGRGEAGHGLANLSPLKYINFADMYKYLDQVIIGGSFTNVRGSNWRLNIIRTPICSSRIRVLYCSKRAHISWGHSRITLLLSGSRILSDPTASVRLLIDLIDLIRPQYLIPLYPTNVRTSA